ncbi:MAG: outer membrane lipoprotein carrier protein LolA [Myxococcales bacterium]|nr:outer membrane lipoprotein carrier protein LolA [Myxococcales bacterium]
MMTPQSRTFGLLLLFFVALFAPYGSNPTYAADAKTQKAIEGLQRFYKEIKDFTADFKQIFTRTRLKRSSKESGRFFFRKPGMMRFQYAKPERKDFVYNGKTLWMYNADDEEVKVRKNVQRTEFGVAVQFLWGSGDLEKSFRIRRRMPFPFGKRGDIRLELIPKKPQSLFKKLYFSVIPGSYQIRETIYIDPAGNRNRFIFSNVRANRGLPKALFTFRVPKGVQVVNLP